MLEYLSRQVVDIKKTVTRQRQSQGRLLQLMRQRLAKVTAEKMQLKQQLNELLKFQ